MMYVFNNSYMVMFMFIAPSLCSKCQYFFEGVRADILFIV